MATQSQKIARITKSKTLVKIGRESFPAPAKLGALAEQGHDIKSQMIILREELEAINAKIVRKIKDKWLTDNGTCHVLIGNVDCTITTRDAVKIIKPGELKDMLGDRYKDLVKETVSYKAYPKLVDMACDDDDTLGLQVKKHLSTKQAKPGVTYKLVER